MRHKQITFDERKILERLRAQKHGIRQCANILGYSPAAISFEIKKGSKNMDRYGRYCAELAQNRTILRKRRARRRGKIFPQQLIKYIQEKLASYWSPEQIEGRLRVDFPDASEMRVTFKTIYRWIEAGKISTEPHLWKGYTRYLRLKRRGKTFTRVAMRSQIKDRRLPSIETRPQAVHQRTRFGDWEGDLIRGFAGQGYIVTLVERSTGLLLAAPCASKHINIVNNAIERAFQNIPHGQIKTITFDRGREFYGYEALKKKFETEIYFCHPHSPNERGQNEQANGLLRQFFPKRTSLKNISFLQVKRAIAFINNRPKKKLNFRTTMEFLEELGLYQVLRLT